MTTKDDIVDPNDNLISLREAITYSQYFQGNTVTFAPSLAGQTFELSQIDDTTFGPTALRPGYNVTIDGGASGVTIKRKASVDRMRLFYVAPGGTLSLRSVTISGGVARGFDGAEGGASPGLGGAIVNAGTLSLNRVTFVGNRATGGGTAGRNVGGGAGLTGPGTFSSGGGPNPGMGTNGVAGNGGFASGGGYGSGGAPGLGGNGGFAGGGGLGDYYGGKGGFGAGGGGGAGAVPGLGGFGGGNAAPVTGGGGAGLGGAIFNYGGVVSGTNVTFSGNAAIGGFSPGSGNGQGLGGALFNLNGKVTFQQATMANNVAPQGGGAIFNLGDNGVSTAGGPGIPAQTASVTLRLCILAGSTDGGATPLPVSDMAQATNDSGAGGGVGAVTSQGPANILQTRAPGDFSGSALTADPRLSALGNFGGSTPTHALLAGSPAIDAGAGVLSSGSDQRGMPRPVGSVTGGLLGHYYTVSSSQSSFLAPISNLEALPSSLLAATPRIDFGVGTEVVEGNGTVLDRDGTGGNPFGGLGVNVGQDNIAALWEGNIAIPETANYEFTTRSDDGSVLLIDGTQVVDNNFFQGMTNRSGVIHLTAGAHTIKVGFYEGGGGAGVQASWRQVDGNAPFARQIIPPSVLSYTSAQPGVADIGAFEADDVLAPVGGTFTVLPGSPLKAGSPLLTSFAGWTDANSLTYEVRDGATVIVPASANPATAFVLPAGIYHLSGYVADPFGYQAVVGLVTVVVDGQAPMIAVPGNLHITATSQDQAVVHFMVGATDDHDPTPTVVVSPPSGSTFPNGTTTVTVKATDDAGNVSTASFDVTVEVDFVGYTKMFSRDAAVPGAGEPDSGIEEGMIFDSFGSPAINTLGDVVLLAKKHIGSVKYSDITVHAGAREAGSSLAIGRRLARVGGTVPTLTGVRWASLKDPLLADDGSVLVLGTIKGTTPATAVPPTEKTILVWYPADAGAAPKVVARTGQTLADASGAKLKSILGMALTEDGVVALTGNLALGSGSPATTGATDRVVVTWDAASGELTTRVREGFSPGAGLPAVKNFKTMVAGAGAGGMGRGWLVSELTTGPGGPATVPHLRVQAAFSDGNTSDLSINLATGVPVVLFANGAAGTGVSGETGVRLKALGLQAAGATDDDAIIRAAPSSGAVGIFAREAGSGLATGLARVGGIAPQSGGATFKTFGDPILSADGASYAFVAKLAGLTPQNDDAIGWGDAGASPHALIAREGGTAPGTGGGVFKKFSSLAAPGGGAGPLLFAKLAAGPGGVTTADDDGLWAVDAGGTLRLLLREGVTTIGTRTVKSFKILPASAGNSRNFNTAGEIVAVVTFMDTTSAVVVMTLPPGNQ